jgi:hypothetical protein
VFCQFRGGFFWSLFLFQSDCVVDDAWFIVYSWQGGRSIARLLGPRPCLQQSQDQRRWRNVNEPRPKAWFGAEVSEVTRHGPAVRRYEVTIQMQRPLRLSCGSRP